MSASVLYIVFNRIDMVKQSFAAIRGYRPEKLFVAADGPRQGKEGELEICEEIRRWILQNVDWPCEVKTLFRDQNLGCGHGVADAVNWFFQNEEEGIILEDDCIASPAFFAFAEKMLEKYREDRRITHISGNSFVAPGRKLSESYFFCRFPFSWGWATWRRAWNLFDFEMKTFPEFQKRRILRDLFPASREMQKRFDKLFSLVYHHSPYFNVWDIQWTYMHMAHGTYSLVPRFNLVSNVGEVGTHAMKHDILNMGTRDLGNLTSPVFDVPDYDYEKAVFNKIYKQENFFIRMKRFVGRLILDNTNRSN